MTPEEIQQTFELAVRRQQAGHLREAEQLYRQILAQRPRQAEAVHYLGLVAHQSGKSDVAVEMIRQAIAIRPEYAEAYGNLGIVLYHLGRLDDAVAACRQAIDLDPRLAQFHNTLGNALVGKRDLDGAALAYRRAIELRADFVEAHCNLAGVLRDLGQIEQAVECCHRALAMDPHSAQAYNKLGLTMKAMEQIDQAIAAFRQAIALKPDFSDAHNNFGNMLAESGRLDDAIVAYRQAIACNPKSALAHSNLGDRLRQMGQLEKAIAACREAIAIDPQFAGAHNNLALALGEQRQFAQAIAGYHRAIQLDPNLYEAHNNLSYTLKELAQLDESIATARHAMQVKPESVMAHDNLIFSLHFHPRFDGRMIREELDRWNQRYAEPLKKFILPHANQRDPDRPLRIGYVSADFHYHPVGRLLLPLLACHDRRNFQIFCYSNLFRTDHVTELFRSRASQWRNVFGLTDMQLADLVREDQIDILVDLSLHTVGNRLLAFARKPAPVQVTWLGYPGSTGLRTIDYRLSDPHLDKPGEDDDHYTERSLLLASTSFCYPGAPQAPPANTLPAQERGHVTFGSFNQFAKLSDATIELWAEVLKSVPSSRLLLKAPRDANLDRISQAAAKHGVAYDRLEFLDHVPIEQYFNLFHRVDICLDPTPYSGHMTTCESLWMGVPVISLRGRTAVGRGGVSVLCNVGLTDWVADSPARYVSIAQAMAGDLSRLVELRRTLRARMLASPLMDAPRFARDIEAAFRQMWRDWCKN